MLFILTFIFLMNHPQQLWADELIYEKGGFTENLVSSDPKSDTLVISIRGKISKSILEKIIQGTQKIPINNKFPPSLVVMLNSNGGDAEAAMEIGKIFRLHHAHVFVIDNCASACVFSFIGGEFRQSLPLSIGIHRARVTMSDRRAIIYSELNSTTNETAKNMLLSFDQKAYKYFEQMDIPLKLYDKIRQQKASDIYWLNSEELKEFHLNTQSEEIVGLIKQWDNGNQPSSLESEKIQILFQHVLKECISFKNEPFNFLKCYKDLLQKK